MCPNFQNPQHRNTAKLELTLKRKQQQEQQQVHPYTFKRQLANNFPVGYTNVDKPTLPDQTCLDMRQTNKQETIHYDIRK